MHANLAWVWRLQGAVSPVIVAGCCSSICLNPTWYLCLAPSLCQPSGCRNLLSWINLKRRTISAIENSENSIPNIFHAFPPIPTDLNLKLKCTKWCSPIGFWSGGWNAASESENYCEKKRLKTVPVQNIKILDINWKVKREREKLGLRSYSF